MGQGREPKMFELLVQQWDEEELGEPSLFFQCL